MQVNKVWVVRTPYTKDMVKTFSTAMNYFMDRAAEMGVKLTWRKGKGSIHNSEPRYHYWEIENELDAQAFFLACGDQIQEQHKRMI